MDGTTSEAGLFTAGVEDEGLRLDLFLSRAAALPRSKAKKGILNGACQVDGVVVKEPDFRLRSGNAVLFTTARESNALLPEAGDITVIYRDKYLAVIDKPANLTVHPCPSCPEGTLVHRLLTHFPELAELEGGRPGIVHRLDKDTTGLIVVALREDVRLSLSEMFSRREVGKTYLALVRGVPPASGTVSLPLGRHPSLKTKMAVVPESKGGRAAHTEWQTLYTDPGKRFALLAVDIHTGRTHQIRVHLAQQGHPLWGDKLYGPTRGPVSGEGVPPADPAPRQMLHAWRLTFAHPVTGKPLVFTCPPPDDFPATATALARQTQRIILTGNPGSGKSLVLGLLEKHGLPVWSADKSVEALYSPGGDAWLMLQGRFADRFIPGPSAPLDRAALTRAMQKDPGLRKEVEAMVHPMVYADMEAFFRAAETSGAEAAVAEVPLWFESREAAAPEGWTVIVVTAPQNLRHERLQATRGWTMDKCAAVESWQWPQQAKEGAANLVLDNSKDLKHLEQAVSNLLKKLADGRQAAEDALAHHLAELWAARQC